MHNFTEIGEWFIKDRSLFLNHYHNGVIDDLAKSIKDDIDLLDVLADVEADDKEFKIGIEMDICTKLVYLKEYLIELALHQATCYN